MSKTSQTRFDWDDELLRLLCDIFLHVGEIMIRNNGVPKCSWDVANKTLRESQQA